MRTRPALATALVLIAGLTVGVASLLSAAEPAEPGVEPVNVPAPVAVPAPARPGPSAPAPAPAERPC